MQLDVRVQLSILFHWSIFLSVCQYHPILIILSFIKFANLKFQSWILVLFPEYSLPLLVYLEILPEI